MSEIKELWEDIPKNADKIENGFLSYIPFYPKCISAKNLSEYLGKTKATISYHIKKHKDSIITFVEKKKHYYQRRNETNETIKKN